MVDIEKLKMLYNFGKNLSLSDVEVLLRSAKIKSYARGDHLIRPGQLKKEVFLIRKGLVRAFRIHESGEEITTMLRWEHQPFASPHLILFGEPAQQFFEALEPTNVFSIDYDELQAILDKNPRLEANRKYIFQNILREALQRLDAFVMLSPEERYMDFIKSNPDIAGRVPDKYIAHILGITPVSLSRIRKRIASKKK